MSTRVPSAISRTLRFLDAKDLLGTEKGADFNISPSLCGSLSVRNSTFRSNRFQDIFEMWCHYMDVWWLNHCKMVTLCGYFVHAIPGVFAPICSLLISRSFPGPPHSQRRLDDWRMVVAEKNSMGISKSCSRPKSFRRKICW